MQASFQRGGAGRARGATMTSYKTTRVSSPDRRATERAAGGCLTPTQRLSVGPGLIFERRWRESRIGEVVTRLPTTRRFGFGNRLVLLERTIDSMSTLEPARQNATP